MDLKNSKARYDKAAEGIKALRSSLKIMGGGGGLVETVMEPVEESLKARSALTRDVTLAKVQGILEAESLQFLTGDAEKREEAKKFLSENPAMYLRALTARVIKETRALPVDTKLSKVVDEI